MTDIDPLARACELVGRFLYYFSRVEAQLDEAITKLFKLNPETAPIITANIDFVRKLYIIRSPSIIKNRNQENLSKTSLRHLIKLPQKIAHEWLLPIARLKPTLATELSSSA